MASTSTKNEDDRKEMEDDFPVEMTPSADAILDVTPPSTFQEEEEEDNADDDDDDEDEDDDDEEGEEEDDNLGHLNTNMGLMEKPSRPHGNYASQDAFSSPSSSGSSSLRSPLSSNQFHQTDVEAASVASVTSSLAAKERTPPSPQQQPHPPQQPSVDIKQSSPLPQQTKQQQPSLPQPPRRQPRPVPNSTYRRSNNFSQSEFDKAVLVAGKTGPAASSKFQHFSSDPSPDTSTNNTSTTTPTSLGSATTNQIQQQQQQQQHVAFLQQAETDVLTEVMSTVEEEDEVDSTDESPVKSTTSPVAAAAAASQVFRTNAPPPPPPPPQQSSKPLQQQQQQHSLQNQHQQQQQGYHLPPAPLPPPPPPATRSTSLTTSRGPPNVSSSTQMSSNTSFPQIQKQQQQIHNLQQQQQDFDRDNLSSGVLPDVLMSMRQKIESLTLFDSDMMRLANAALTSTPLVHQNHPRNHHSHHHNNHHPQQHQLLAEDDYMFQETRESLKRSSQQSISAAVLVGLAHKRYERRRLAAMEIEKVVRSLVVQAFQEEEEQKKQGILLPTSCSSSLDRVRAILLLLSDDYVRSTSEDARKGGVVALAACAIGLKKAPEALIVQYQNIIASGGGGGGGNNNYNNNSNNNKNGYASFNAAVVLECRDLILASVVHACQDHSQRVRYYATESLFNVVKILPTLAVQHFFILFEILRSLYADADVDVRSGAELLDKKMKEVIVGAINSGSFTAEACVPVFARFVSMRNKATKRLTLTWLQELNEKLIGTPILEFLHLFLAGIFAMIADPNVSIRQSALAFLQSVLPKLLIVNHHNQQAYQQQQQQQQHQPPGTNNDHEDAIDDEEDRMTNKVDFDKILQSLVTSMEHPDPYVRKIAVYWMSRIVKTWFGSPALMGEQVAPTPTVPPTATISIVNPDGSVTTSTAKGDLSTISAVKPSTPPPPPPPLSAAALSVRNSLPHVLPGILLSIGDTSTEGSARDSFLPDQTTHALADQTNACLQEAVRRDGKSYIQHLDGFIVALREELDSPGGLTAAKNQPAVEHRPYRTDVNLDGTGIESPGWFRSNVDASVPERENDSMMMSRLCALHWIIVLYDSVVPDVLKADYAREFIGPIIHQLVDSPSDFIIFKSFEVLARITVPVHGEKGLLRVTSSSSISGISSVPWATTGSNGSDEAQVMFPMNNASIGFALDIMEPSRRKHMSRDREVFSALIQLHSSNHRLLVDFSRVVAFMCTLQPPEFVFVSFAVEIDRFVRERSKLAEQSSLVRHLKQSSATPSGTTTTSQESGKLSATDYEFVSTFVQQLGHTLLNTEEAKVLRLLLRDCIGSKAQSERDNQCTRLFHILLHSFSHNLVASLSLCMWAGAYRTTSLFLKTIDPLDVNLMFLLELDKLVEMLERPLFRNLHVRMLEPDKNPSAEGSGTMLFRTLKLLLMIIPQSTCYSVLRDRLVSISRLRQTIAIAAPSTQNEAPLADETKLYVSRVMEVRTLHCEARWQAIRAESLETIKPAIPQRDDGKEEGTDRRNWLGYASRDDEQGSRARFLEEQRRWKSGLSIEEVHNTYHDFESLPRATVKDLVSNDEQRDGLTLNHVNDAVLAREEADEEETEWKEFWAMKSMNE